MRCLPSGLIYSKPSVMHNTRGPLEASILPGRLGGVFSGPAPPGRSRSLRPHFRWHTVGVRRGPDSFMSRCLPVSARLSPDILRVAIRGPIALRGMELRTWYGSNGSQIGRILAKCWGLRIKIDPLSAAREPAQFVVQNQTTKFVTAYWAENRMARVLICDSIDEKWRV